MAELSERCLDHIFGFLSPIDWIQFAEVCQFWKKTVSKQWKKITTISYEDYQTEPNRYEETPVLISASDAEKILLHAAEFCTALRALSGSYEKDIFIMLEVFFYKVEKFDTDRILKLLTENATEITDAWLDQQTNAELLQVLFVKNKIKNLRIDAESNFLRDFLQYVPTDGIEKLQLRFEYPHENYTSFNGHFSNLKTLVIEASSWNYHDPYDFHRSLAKILPYVLGIKSLTLDLRQFYILNTFLKHIVKFSQLEELTIMLECDSEMPVKFNLKLETNCPNLRLVNLDNLEISNAAVLSMLSLPNLERVDLKNSWSRFTFKQELPEMNKLNEFAISFFESEHANVRKLCNAIKKMPALQSLRVSGLTKQQNLMLISEASVFATSLGKDVALIKTGSFENIHWKLKIESEENVEQVDVPTLTLEFSCYEGTSLDTVEEFVQKRLKGYRAVELEANGDQPARG